MSDTISNEPGSIRAYRDRAGLTQAQLAAALGVDAGTVARWERGELNPPPYLWRALEHLTQDAERLRAVLREQSHRLPKRSKTPGG